MDLPRPSLDPVDFTPAEAAAARQGITDFLEVLEPGQIEIVMAMAVRRDEDSFTVAKADLSLSLEDVLENPLLEAGTLEQAVETVYEHGHWVTVEEIIAAEANRPADDLSELAGLEDLPGLDGPYRVDEIGDLSGLADFEDLSGVAGHWVDDDEIDFEL